MSRPLANRVLSNAVGFRALDVIVRIALPRKRGGTFELRILHVRPHSPDPPPPPPHSQCARRCCVSNFANWNVRVGNIATMALSAVVSRVKNTIDVLRWRGFVARFVLRSRKRQLEFVASNWRKDKQNPLKESLQSFWIPRAPVCAFREFRTKYKTGISRANSLCARALIYVTISS